MNSSKQPRNVSNDRNGNQNLEVGDTVDVPGGMHGIIKFIGEVRGKAGVFAGVELAKEWAHRGKNDGDVEGTRYFTTSVKGAGIFLPSTKAYKRLSPVSSDSMPPTPTSSSLASFNLGGRGEAKANTPPQISSKFAQTTGPGRASSPALKQKVRPSLPRPESPLRKTQNTLPTLHNRPSLGGTKLSRSMIGAQSYAPSPTSKFGGSVRGRANGAGDPRKPLPMTPKPAIKMPTGRPPSRSASRGGSRLGPEPMFDEELESTPDATTKNPSKIEPAQHTPGSNPSQDEEMKQLRLRLKERDKQLEKYSSDLNDMQNSITELQSTNNKHSSATTVRSSRGSGIDELDASSLRATVREKNEKIASLTHEFDTHRADFRETIDILEHTSDETNRHYEERIETLQAELREMHDRGNDVESVAEQLKQLEGLVQDLEEGLEDARRGESEARGEVEFLRGEVERGRSELRHEKDKAATSNKNGSVDSPGARSREVEQRDDEIRGLKAIIHSLSRDALPEVGSPKTSRRLSKQRHSGNGQANGNEVQIAEERQARQKLQREIKELEGLVDSKTYREEELEHEIERLRKTNSMVTSGSINVSDHTVMPAGNHQLNLGKSSIDQQRQSSSEARPNGSHFGPAPAASDSHSTMTDSSALWCEVCDTGGHDILTCTNMFGNANRLGNQTNHRHERDHNENDARRGDPPSHRRSHDKSREGLKPFASPQLNDYPAPLSPARSPGPQSAEATPRMQQAKMPNPMDQGMVAGKDSGIVDSGKWCAVCERDGHESVDCPFDDAY